MSTRDRIGGSLDMAALGALAGVSYDARARHRPVELAAIAIEVRRLHGTGLTPRDISVALRLPLPEVYLALQVRE